MVVGKMINLTIDGKLVTVPEGTLIIDACRHIGIDIPVLCEDERMKPAAKCKLCAVKVEWRDELILSCCMQVKSGMTIWTNTEEVRAFRKARLEEILETHPDDCLTCEKVGNCTLQNYAYEYGVDRQRYRYEHEEDGYNEKAYAIDKSNKFYYFDKNKCIDCRRCTRVCSDLQVQNAITPENRGFKVHSGVHPYVPLSETDCVSCGNCVSVCPTGALMEKKKESFREWDVKKVRTTCSYCGVGCQFNLKVVKDKVVGVEPLNDGPNSGLLCVKGKFGYKFLNNPDRLTHPLIKENGEFRKASWEEAYALIKKKADEIMESDGPDAFAGLSSARCTNEENYSFQKLFRTVFKTNNVDHCARL